MTEIDESEFLAWAREGGIAKDTRYHEPRCLVFEEISSHSRFWEYPGEASLWKTFFRDILALIGDTEAIYLWPRGGCWMFFPGDVTEPSDLPTAKTVESYGRVVLSCSPDEADMLGEFLCFIARNGFYVGHDVFVVPTNRSLIAYLDHHNVVHVEAKDEESITQAVQFMLSRGHILPDDYPDSTFKPQSWLNPE